MRNSQDAHLKFVAIPTALASVSPHSSTPGPSKTPILIAVATIIPLLAALAIALAIFRCRRHLTRARAPSVTTSQVHLEAQDSEFLGEKQSMRGHWSRVVPDVATSYPKSHTECPQATPPSDILGPELGDAPNFGSNNDVVEIVAQPDSDAAAVVVRPRRYGVITPFVKRYQSISSSAVAATPAMVSVGTSCPASVGPSIIHGRPTDGTAQDGPGIDSGGAYEVMNDDSSGIADSIAPPPYSQID